MLGVVFQGRSGAAYGSLGPLASGLRLGEKVLARCCSTNQPDGGTTGCRLNTTLGSPAAGAGRAVPPATPARSLAADRVALGVGVGVVGVLDHFGDTLGTHTRGRHKRWETFKTSTHIEQRQPAKMQHREREMV